MAIPKYYEMYKSFLFSLLDGEVHTLEDSRKQVIKDFKLTDEDLAELLPSGKGSTFSGRVGWCKTYLKKAGLIDSPSKAHFVITEDGKRIYNSVDVITDETLCEFPSFIEFKYGGKSKNKPDFVETNEETPQETLERVHSELNKVLREELLAKIYANSPSFFERLVVELMEKMGYGTGKVTQQSRDEGIDGIVYQDKLGFDVIYVQAKRYELDKTIGRPLLQQFFGAVPMNAKCMFVTTSKFSSEAIKFADEKHIILIDGTRLAQLMIDNDFGVSTEYVYKVKRVDSDIFEEE